MTGAMVQLFRQHNAGGTMRTTGAGSPGRTNDLGQFRVWSLPAGDYIVTALFSSPSPFTAEDRVREGSLPTFYPGVAVYQNAKAVAVKAGQETGGIDFSLVAGRFGSVSGMATDSAGNPLTSGPGMRANVSLASRSPTPGLRNRDAIVKPDGSFAITDVPPGDY